MLAGGPPRQLAETPQISLMGTFALDPRGGPPIYQANVVFDSDIGLFRLTHR